MKNNTKRIACPICNGSNLHKIFSQKFSPMSNGGIIESYDVSVCPNCSMAFANNIPSQAEMDSYYFSFNKYENSSPRSMPNTPWNDKILEYITANFSTTAKITDIGCGTGKLLLDLADKGYTNLTGIDTSSDNCQRLESLGINSINNSIFDIEESSISSELIISVGVLEHIVDLKQFIKKMVSFLDPNGRMIICVPEIIVNNAKKFPFQEFSTEHINYFTYSSLCKIFEKFNLYPIDKISTDDTMTIVFAFNQIDIEHVLNRYVLESNNTIEKCLNNIKQLILSQKPVTVWGVGTLTRYLLSNTAFSKLNIIAFTDGNKKYHGSSIFNKEIIEPANIDNDSTIVICAYNAGNDIITSIRNLNLSNDVIDILKDI